MRSGGSLEPDPRWERSSTADEGALRAAIDACVRDYPGATRDQVEQLVRTLYERTAGAKVHQYRVLLAERDARVQLRADERTRTEQSGQRDSHPPRRLPAPTDDRPGETSEPPTKGLAWMS